LRTANKLRFGNIPVVNNLKEKHEINLVGKNRTQRALTTESAAYAHFGTCTPTGTPDGYLIGNLVLRSMAG
jgi:hypothetical protein